MKTITLALAASAVALASPAAADTLEYNAMPDAGWFFGSGNDYTPANSIVLTTDADDQLALRLHERGVRAPASDSMGVYSFSLGQDPVNFDWSIDNESASTISARIYVRNLMTGQSYFYDPLGIPNDNAVSGDTAQNSFRIGGFGSPPLIGWDPNVDNTYRVDLVVDGFGGGRKQVTGFAQMGAGAGFVPEPGTWALFILGFGAIGAAMRRRSASVSYA